MTLAQTDYDFFASFLRQRSAISITPDKDYLIKSRLTPIARDRGFADTDALIEHLRSPALDSELAAAVVEAMTTNETSFFRDHRPFDALREHVIPDLLARNASSRRLNIWSAAASTGQELYSIAMLLDQHFPELAGWNVRLIGTDLSNDVLERTRRGRYSPLEINRGLPAPMLVRYFARDGAEYVIAPEIRRRCEFVQLNLAKPWPGTLPQFDIVLCRNVLIYFEIEDRVDILRRIRTVLGAGGYLLLGSTETTVGLVSDYQAHQTGTSVVYRVETK